MYPKQSIQDDIVSGPVRTSDRIKTRPPAHNRADVRRFSMEERNTRPRSPRRVLHQGMGITVSRGDSWKGAVDGEDEYYSLVLNFKEAVFGVEKEIEKTCNKI